MRISPIFCLLSMLACATAAHAAPRAALDAASKPDLSKNAPDKDGFRELADDQRASEIARVEAYLSGITTVSANFTQTSADGSVGEGKFLLKRPGKMRWQYNPPTPILLVSDGNVVVYYDPGLDQVTYIGIDDTPAGFLTQKDIRLDNPATKLTRFMKAEDGRIRLTVVQAKKPTEGSLTLEFSDKPLELKQMITVDATGNETRVQLKDTQFGEKLDDKQFVFVDPRTVNAKRNKKK